MLWKEKFRIGIQEIDIQHEELFCRVADFLLALRQEGCWEDKLPRVKATMEFMQKYVVIHFDCEEAFQRQINYPMYAEHRALHEAFKQEVVRYGKVLADKDFPEEVVQELAGKLLTWLIHHVANNDIKMASYINKAEGTSHETRI